MIPVGLAGTLVGIVVVCELEPVSRLKKDGLGYAKNATFVYFV